MKTKKAILMPEVMRIILAVLGIIVLIMLATSLYTLFTRSNELEQAKATLNEILGKADSLGKSGEHTDVLILAPSGWRILAYPEEKKLCICKGADKDSQKEECEGRGTCQKRNYATQMWGMVSDCVEEGIDNCINLDKSQLPLELTLLNQGGIIKLKSGNYEFIEVQSSLGNGEAAVSPKDEPVKTIDFIDYLIPNSQEDTFRTLLPGNNPLNDPAIVHMRNSPNENAVILSMFSQKSGFNIDEDVGKIESDGVVWLSGDSFNYLKFEGNIFENAQEYENRILEFSSDLLVDSSKVAPVSNSPTMKFFIVVRQEAKVGSQPYQVYVPIYKTNLKVNFEEVKKATIYENTK